MPYKYEKVRFSISSGVPLCPKRETFLPQTIKTHTKFVQDVQYARSGDQFASVGSDSKIFLYDGKTGDTLVEFTDSPHKGSIVREFRRFFEILDCSLHLKFRWPVPGALTVNPCLLHRRIVQLNFVRGHGTAIKINPTVFFLRGCSNTEGSNNVDFRVWGQSSTSRQHMERPKRPRIPVNLRRPQRFRSSDRR